MIEGRLVPSFDPEDVRRDQHVNGSHDLGDKHLQSIAWVPESKDVTRCPEWVAQEKQRVALMVQREGAAERSKPLRARVITPEMRTFYRLQAKPGLEYIYHARALLESPSVRENLYPNELRHAQHNIGLTDLASRLS